MYFLNSFAKVVLIGQVGAEPEISSVGNENRSLCKFSLATKQTISAEAEVQTLWHQVIAWGKKAETASKALNSGDLVRVSANIDCNEWTDKFEQKRKDVQFVLDEFVILKRKNSDGEAKTAPKDESKKSGKKGS